MKKILVADDSVTIQKVIALTFSEEQFEIQSVGSGSEALEKLKEWRPDIVLADVIMPQMNGYELARAVKGNEETGNIPVILLAGTFEAFDEEEARSAGADGYITKPFESGELIDKVKAALGAPAGAPPEPSPAVETAPVATAPPEEAPAAPETAPETAPPPAAEAPREAPSAGAEPDIWDILSESDEDQPPASPPTADAESSAPSFGPLEGGGVVDVGTFEVGIERGSEADQAFQVPEPSADAQIPAPTETGSVDLEAVDERSKVEERERDFFGFDMEGEGADAAVQIPDDAIEEVSFDIEEVSPEPAPMPGPVQEPPFPAGEPVVSGQGQVGEMPAPEIFEPEPVSAGLPDQPPPPIQEPPLELPVDDLLTADSDTLEVIPEEHGLPRVEAPDQASMSPSADGLAEASPAMEPAVAQGAEASEAPIVPEPAMEVFPEPQTVPESYAPADQALTVQEKDLPAAPPTEPAGEAPISPAVQAPEAAQPEPLAGGDVEAMTRKIIEEKVEKIAWEVVPEMAEVLIKEAIEKIKGGS